MKITKKLWKSIKPLFSGKCKSKTNITLVENEQMVTEKREVAEFLNNYFIEAVQNFEIEKFNPMVNEQMTSYIEKYLSPYIFGYRKGHGTQHCLLAMIEM